FLIRIVTLPGEVIGVSVMSSTFSALSRTDSPWKGPRKSGAAELRSPRLVASRACSAICLKWKIDGRPDGA
ncbi:MAG: hypothetical protein M1368_06840, partial [Thaumarchaeota archaeon]|nr:hypothetical protein [Nitrososphaerota archaeon]